MKLARRLLLQKVIIEDHLDVYVYGFELLISSLFSTLLILLIGVLTHNILETIAFLATFILLRSFSGGYHAKTYIVCSIVTFAIFGTALILANNILPNIISYMILIVAGFSVLFGFAPIENPNKQFSIVQRKRYKTVSIVLFVLLAFTGMVFIDLFPNVSSTIFFVLIADLILLFIKTDRKEKHNESI